MWTKRTAVGLVWLCFKQYVFAGGGDEKTFPRLMGIESRDVIFSLNIGGVKTQYKCFFAIHCWRRGLMVIHWFWVIALLYFWQGIAGRLVVLGSVEEFLYRQDDRAVFSPFAGRRVLDLMSFLTIPLV